MQLKSWILTLYVEQQGPVSAGPGGVIAVQIHGNKEHIQDICKHLKCCLRSYIAQTIELTTFCPKPQACGA